MDAAALDARDPRAQGAPAGREDQGVVGERGFLAVLFSQADGLGRGIDGDRLSLRPHVDGVVLSEFLWRHDEQLVPFADDGAHVVGQAAAGEGGIGTPLDDGDLGILVEAAQACGGSGATGDTADDDIAFHFCSPFG